MCLPAAAALSLGSSALSFCSYLLLPPFVPPKRLLLPRCVLHMTLLFVVLCMVMFEMVRPVTNVASVITNNLAEPCILLPHCDSTGRKQSLRSERETQRSARLAASKIAAVRVCCWMKLDCSPARMPVRTEQVVYLLHGRAGTSAGPAVFLVVVVLFTEEHPILKAARSGVVQQVPSDGPHLCVARGEQQGQGLVGGSYVRRALTMLKGERITPRLETVTNAD